MRMPERKSTQVTGSRSLLAARLSSANGSRISRVLRYEDAPCLRAGGSLRSLGNVN
jgi:hypothetical protein